MQNIVSTLEERIAAIIPLIMDNIEFIAVAFLITLAVIYIIALILSKKTKCIIIWGWKDLLVLAFLSISIIAILVITLRKISDVPANTVPVLGVIALVLCVLTILNSFLSNITSMPPASIIYIVISILTKMILLAVIPVIVLLYMSYNSDSSYKKDGRYRDGTKGNIKTQKLATFAVVVSFMVGTLIKKRK